MRFCTVLLAALVCLPSAGLAQTPDPAPPAESAPAPDPGPTLRVGGYVQYDWLAPLDDDTSDQTFRFRRVRLSVGGDLVEHVSWLVTFEATSTPILRDAYVELEHIPGASIRVGQFVMPYGIEQYVFSSNSLEFTERLLVSMVASRDAGIMVSNARPFGGWLTYAAAVTNGTGQNVRDNNDAKDTILRLTATPPAIPGLQVSVNGLWGEQPAAMRKRRGADVSFERRAFHLAAEFQSEHMDDVQTREGFYVLGSWRFYPPAPRRAFHHLEVGSRYGRITGTDPMGQWEVSANYYVQPSLRFMCDYIVHTERDPGEPRHTLHARANIRF